MYDLYDYIMLCSDATYSGKIKTDVFEKYLLMTLNLRKDSSLKFSKELNGQYIRITGILANSYGNYAFNTLDGVEEINLIEIDVPSFIDDEIEKEILRIAFAIAKEFSWDIYNRDISQKIEPD